MESSTWPESLPSNRIQAMQKLTQGQELMNKLCEMLWWPKNIDSSPISEDDLVVQIQGMFEKSLSIMSSCNSNESLQLIMSDLHSPCSSDGDKSRNSDEILKNKTARKIQRGCYKRKKTTWTSTQFASVLVDDGHAWRKYGQKQIMSSKFQRSYYRCTYKYDQGCQATKQVQKIQDNPTKYKTIYSGEHTCTNLQRAPPIVLDFPEPKDTSFILSFKKKGFVDNKQVEPTFPSINRERKEGFSSIRNFRHNKSSSSKKHLSTEHSTYLSKRPLEPISMTPLMFGHRDMIPLEEYSYNGGTHGFEMDNMLGRNDFNDFPYELCF